MRLFVDEQRTKIFDLHYKTILSILRTMDGRIVTCSTDKSICLFDLTTEKKFYYQPFEGYSFCLSTNSKEKKELIYSGGEDRKIYIWELKNQLFLRNSFESHDREVRCLKYFDEKLISSSYDQSIKIWKEKIETKFECIQKIFNEMGPIFSLSLFKSNENEESLYFSGWGSEIQIYKKSSNSQLFQFALKKKVHNSFIKKIMLIDSFIYSCSYDGDFISFLYKKFYEKKRNYKHF